MEKIYTPQEVADQLKIKKATVYELIKRGELNASKIGKQIRISQDQLNEYLKLPPIMDIPQFTADSAIRQTDYLLNTNGLIINSQESRVVELLRIALCNRPETLPVLHSYMNDYNSLYSLYYEKTHMALTCFLTGPNQQEFDRVLSLMPGKEVAILHICRLQAGFYIKKGNPKNIRSVKDLCRPDIRFLNRENGSGYRIFLDSLFIEENIEKETVNGYTNECLSHMSAANAVAAGTADVSIGDLSHLSSYPQLEAIPLSTASMNLVILKSFISHPAFQIIANTLDSTEFKNGLLHFDGYDINQTGKIWFLHG